MVTHDHVKRCVGKWVICHTRYGDYHGQVEACGGDHIVLYAPNKRPFHVRASNKTPTSIRLAFDTCSPHENPVHCIYPGGFGYWGYGAYGIGRVVIPLAAIFGLTVIGASALWW